jgi:hypothetical protein
MRTWLTLVLQIAARDPGEILSVMKKNHMCLHRQSVLGVLRERTPSKVPAQASRAVKKGACRLKSFFTVAGIDECSYCDVGVGPFGSCTTAPHNTLDAHNHEIHQLQCYPSPGPTDITDTIPTLKKFSCA